MLEQITGEVVTDDQEQPSPKSKLAAMKKAKDDAIAEAEKKKKLLTPERTIEIADSLMDSANRKKKLSYEQKRIGEAGIKKGNGDKQAFFYSNSNIGTGPTYNQRMEIAEKAKKEATTDSANAVRYKSLALKAMGKNE